MNTNKGIIKSPTNDDIFDRVANIASLLLGIDKNEIRMESLLEKDLGADELDIVELIMTLENEFGISLPDDIFLPNIEEEDYEYQEVCEEDECDDEVVDFFEDTEDDEDGEFDDEVVDFFEDTEDDEDEEFEEVEEDEFDDNETTFIVYEPYPLSIADYVTFIKNAIESE